MKSYRLWQRAAAFAIALLPVFVMPSTHAASSETSTRQLARVSAQFAKYALRLPYVEGVQSSNDDMATVVVIRAMSKDDVSKKAMELAEKFSAIRRRFLKRLKAENCFVWFCDPTGVGLGGATPLME